MESNLPDEGTVEAAGKRAARRVLLAEGDAVLSDLYAKGLEDDGWSVEVVHDGQAALNRALESPPDVLLMNTMPGLTSREVLERIRDHEPTKALPVILLANSYQDPGLQEVEDLEVLAVLIKSRSIRNDLSETIRGLLESRDSVAEESGEAS